MKNSVDTVAPVSPMLLLQAARKLFLRGFIFAAVASFFLNFAALTGSLFMIQVYERVMPTAPP